MNNELITFSHVSKQGNFWSSGVIISLNKKTIAVKLHNGKIFRGYKLFGSIFNYYEIPIWNGKNNILDRHIVDKLVLEPIHVITLYYE